MKHSRPGSIDDLFQALQHIMQETLQQGGFGSFSIHSQRSVSYTRQEVLLCDSTQYSFTFTDEEIDIWQALTLKNHAANDHSLEARSQPEQLLHCVQQRLLRTWSETGRGYLEVKCERSGRNTTRVIIGGAPSYCCYLSEQEIHRWLEEKQVVDQPIDSIL